MNDQSVRFPPSGFGAPLLVVISGPAAVGKTTVLRRMQQLALPYTIGVTCTTRPMRPGEVDGLDYHFISEEQFAKMLAIDEFIEHAVVHGTHSYGIPRSTLRAALAEGQDVIVPPEVQGAATVRAKVPGVVDIFIAAPSFPHLEERIRRRGAADEAEIQRRLATARAEMARVDEFQYLVINEDGKVDHTVAVIDAIIRAEKQRLHRIPLVL